MKLSSTGFDFFDLGMQNITSHDICREVTAEKLENVCSELHFRVLLCNMRGDKN